MTLAIGITLLIIAVRPLICVSRRIWINRTRSRHGTTACIVTILAAGCAQNVPKTPGYFAEQHDAKALTINKVALATDTSPPVIDSVDLGFTREEGAASGAAGGAAAGASVPLEILGDVVLEIDLLKVNLQHALEMEAEARLISVETGDVLNKGHYRFVSEKRRVKGWMADGAAPLTEAIRRGLATLAEDAIDENFLLYYPEESKNVPNTYTHETNNQPDALRNPLIPHYVLSAISPEVERCLLCEVPFGRHPHRAR